MKQKILIIDDEAPIREVLSYALQKAGYETVLKSDGIEAIRYLERNAVDLIITDILMPNKDGVEILNSLRKDTAKTPIIAMSGGGKIDAIDYEKICKLLGAVEFVPKPFAPSKIVKLVKRLSNAPASP